MHSTMRRSSAATRLAAAVAVLSLPVAGAAVLSSPADAASSDGCEGGGFKVLGNSPGFAGTVAAPARRFPVKASTRSSTSTRPTSRSTPGFTGARTRRTKPAAGDGIYASRVPDHRGLALTSRISLRWVRPTSRSPEPGLASP